MCLDHVVSGRVVWKLNSGLPVTFYERLYVTQTFSDSALCLANICPVGQFKIVKLGIVLVNFVGCLQLTCGRVSCFVYVMVGLHYLNY